MNNFPESFTRTECWILQTAIVMGYAINPVERFYNHDDWFLDSEIADCFEEGERIHLSCEEYMQIRSKPALTQTMDWSRTERVTRLTKLGWQKARELAIRWAEETENWASISGMSDEDFWYRLDNAI